MFLSLQVFAFQRQIKYDVYCEWVANLLYKLWRRALRNCGGEIVTRCSRISANSLWVLLRFHIPTDSSSHSRNDKLIVWSITSHGVHFEAAVSSFVSVAWFKWQTSLPKIGVSQINPPKQTSRYLIYLANLFLNQSMKRLFRWKQISRPLKLETLIATFWVPETTKRPRCITVSENGSLRLVSSSLATESES